MIFIIFFSLVHRSLTTYKELCSLASDLNQPDLVYKFMNLANHHAMWNSRKVSSSCITLVLPVPSLCPQVLSSLLLFREQLSVST